MEWILATIILFLLLKDTYNNNRVQKQLIENVSLQHQQNAILFEILQTKIAADTNVKELLKLTQPIPPNGQPRRFGGRSDEDETRIAKLKEQQHES